MNLNKNEKVLIFISLIVLIIFIIIVIYSLLSKDSVLNKLQNSSSSANLPPVEYNQDAQEKLAKIIEKRPNISEKDLTIRAKILKVIKGDTGILKENNKYIISYLKSPDLFQVEILTTEINGAKLEATTWFYNQGLSKEGICGLPLMFFLNNEVQSVLENSDVVFSPLPPGC